MNPKYFVLAIITFVFFLFSAENTQAQTFINCKNKALSANPPLAIVDGVTTTMEFLNGINPDEIQSIEVLKGTEAVAQYGDKAKEGVILITRKKTTSPLIIIDGEESEGIKNNLQPYEIQSVTVLKAEQAVAQYGDKGKNGVIVIVRKK